MCDKIVIQLQMDALDKEADIETLLRKAYLVARKLKLNDFEEWISNEQNGYDSCIPDYRIVGGEICGWNPYRGWIPVIMQSDVHDLLTKMPVGSPISSIVDAYRNTEGEIILLLNGRITETLNKSCKTQTKYCMRASKGELHKIISAVRNKILDWSILLEENGILGEGLSFNTTEIQKAQKNELIKNYTNNFYSKVEQVDICQMNKT